MYIDSVGKFPEWILDFFNISDVSSQWFYRQETARIQVSVDLISLVSRKPNAKMQIGAFQKYSLYNNSAKLGHDFGAISIYKKTTTDILSLTFFEGFTGNIDTNTGDFKFDSSIEASISVISIRNSWGISIDDFVKLKLDFILDLAILI